LQNIKKFFPTWKDNIKIYVTEIFLNVQTVLLLVIDRRSFIYSASMQFLYLLTDCSSKNVVRNLGTGISPILIAYIEAPPPPPPPPHPRFDAKC